MAKDSEASDARLSVTNEKTDDEKKTPKIARKIVARRLPPKLSSDEFINIVGPLGEHSYFEFVPGDLSLEPHAFSRAYINFKNDEDLFNFRNRFDGYVFVDGRGNDYHAVVEFATYQKVPLCKSRVKKDPKVGTIFDDPEYLQFVESLEHTSNSGLANPEAFLEELDVKEKEAKNKELSTPLLEYVRDKRAEHERRIQERHEARKKRDDERRRAREENRKKKKQNAEKAFLELVSKKYASADSVISDKRNSNDEAEDIEAADPKSKTRKTRRERRAERMEKEGDKAKKKEGEKDPRKKDRIGERGLNKKDGGEKTVRETSSNPVVLERKEKGKPTEESGVRSQNTSGSSNAVNTKTKEEREIERRERIRLKNKERPAMEIYRPGMGKFSAQSVKGNETQQENSTFEKDVSEGDSSGKVEEFKSNRPPRKSGGRDKKNDKQGVKGDAEEVLSTYPEGVVRREREDNRSKQPPSDERNFKKKPLKSEDDRLADSQGQRGSQGARINPKNRQRGENQGVERQAQENLEEPVGPSFLSNPDQQKKSGKSYLTKRRERQQEREENNAKLDEQGPSEP